MYDAPWNATAMWLRKIMYYNHLLVPSHSAAYLAELDRDTVGPLYPLYIIRPFVMSMFIPHVSPARAAMGVITIIKARNQLVRVNRISLSCRKGLYLLCFISNGNGLHCQ